LLSRLCSLAKEFKQKSLETILGKTKFSNREVDFPIQKYQKERKKEEEKTSSRDR